MTLELGHELEQLVGERVLALRAVTGGDINLAYQASLPGGRRVFVKTRPNAPRGLYAREAEGLAWLREARALPVPEVLCVDERMLVLTWIESSARRSDFDEQLGRGLGQLHRAGAASFGFEASNFIANLPQDNRPCSSWPAFYAERRLLPFAERAERAGTLGARQLRRIESLCAALPNLCGPSEPPARLHGDLWNGNVMSDGEGLPVLIDPAVYAGHREVDLAMLRLFGSPSAHFFAAYEEAYPLAPGAEERVALYQLWPLLVHVCLFGASYVGAVDRALARYA